MKDKIPEEVLNEIFGRRLKRKNMNEEIYQKLRQMILAGKLKKGERLVQEKLALSFNVSRQTILTALHQLKDDGLITWKYREGSFVDWTELK
jgi:DNA-binding GntR family transcriptional regulator